MKPEKYTFIYKGKERTCVIEQGRNFIATDMETQFSGNGSTAEAALAALIRNLDLPDPRTKSKN